MHSTVYIRLLLHFCRTAPTAWQVVYLVLISSISGTTFSRDTFNSTFKQFLKRFFSTLMSIQSETLCRTVLSLERCVFGRWYVV
ncbi:uncharacterized protein BJ212DRAFT_1340970 [Suillus subaureus]|uniref:Uncharacterized protein n=1 Tax=Suillus subaureus TaxID=48587 RepID=A0A9P7EFX3_9AGAM|nr:uncharacterized protein BJ212DRAFT_1340970 [Suillus subaureus]KAG1820587.1 hypothetical protein BJ212DRAFT_1340970 [Suillus subaureus]